MKKLLLTALIVSTATLNICFAESKIENISLLILLTNGEKYDGKKIHTSGFFCLAGYTFSLQLSSESCNLSPQGYGIELALSYEMQVKHESFGSNGFVEITGIYTHLIGPNKVSTGAYSGEMTNINITKKFDFSVNPGLSRYKPASNSEAKLLKSKLNDFKRTAVKKDIDGILEYFGLDKKSISNTARWEWVMNGSSNSILDQQFSNFYFFKAKNNGDNPLPDYKLCACTEPFCEFSKKAEATISGLLRGEKEVCYDYYLSGGEIRLNHDQFFDW